MPFNSYGPLTGNIMQSLSTVYNERERDASAIKQLENGRVIGRLRNAGANARAVPTSNSDVLTGDAEGDRLYDASYLYLCVNISGELKWGRIALDTTW